MHCEANTKVGTRCRALALGGSRFCFFHDSTLLEARKRAQTEGGRASGRTREALPVDEFELSDPVKILAMLTVATNLVFSGRLDAKRAHALGHLADCALKAYPLGKAKEMQELILQRLEEHHTRPPDFGEADRLLRFVQDDGEIGFAGLPQRRDEAHAEPLFANEDHARDPVTKQI